MKKQIIILAILASILQGTFSFASTLLVKEYGVNNTYATIQAAIAAAVNNDTILVYTKPSGQLWLENITIDKNLWIANPIDTARFTLQGNVTIVPKAGMQLFMVGYNLVGGGSVAVSATGATATSASRATVLMSDCIITGSVSLDIDWIAAQIAYCNVTGSVTLRHGAVLGNTISGGIAYNEESTTAAQNDSILVIGNIAPALTVATKEAGIISNNYFARSNFGAVVNIVSHNPSDSAKFIISNNTILNSGNSNITPGCYASCGYTSNMSGFTCCLQLPKYNNTVVINNIMGVNPTFSNGATSYTINCGCGNQTYTISSNTTSINCPSGSGQPLISYNIFANTFGTAASNNFNNVGVNNEYNQYGAYSLFGSIDAYGRPTAGNTSCINKGIYLGQYYDIDLTRNDVGTYGGPFSIDNYLTSSTSKGRAVYINVPHQINNINQQINIKATGVSKF